MGEPNLFFQVRRQQGRALRQRVFRAAHDANAIVNKGYKFEVVTWICEDLRSEDQIDLPAFQHRAQFVDKAGAQFDPAARVLFFELRERVRQKPPRNNRWRPYPEFPHSPRERLIGCCTCLIFGDADGEATARKPQTKRGGDAAPAFAPKKGRAQTLFESAHIPAEGWLRDAKPVSGRLEGPGLYHDG